MADGKKIVFDATVRRHGNTEPMICGRITKRKLVPFIDKEVEVTVVAKKHKRRSK